MFMYYIMIIYLQVRLLSAAPLVPYIRKAVTVTEEAITEPRIENKIGYFLNNNTNIEEKEVNEEK